MKYSIDMINLHLIIPRTMFLGLGEDIDGQDFIQRILFNETSTEFTYFETKKHSAYRYNVTQTTEEGTVYFGLMHNSKNNRNEIDIKIEYNPNKFDDIPYRVNVLCSLAKVVKIKSFDYALDLDINIKNIIFAESLKQVNVYKGTYYIGERSNGIKIYDKAKQLKINDMDWTRIEYRIPIDHIIKGVCEFDLLESLEEHRFPNIHYFDDTFEEEQTDVEIILLLEGAKARPDLIKKLSRRKKEKINSAIEQLAKVDYSTIKRDMKHYLKNYIDELIIH